MININARAVGFIAAAVAPAVPVAVFAETIEAGFGQGGVVALCLVTVLWSFAVILVYWRGIDEVARDAQKTAWLWGGPVGIVVGLLALVAPTPLRAVIADEIGLKAFLAGALYVLAAQLIGFLVFWIGWWIVKR